MFDTNSPHLALPLPHPDNRLEDDVPRIRTALLALDGKLQTIDTLLASDDVNFDALQELVTALKADGSAIQSILATLAAKADASQVDARLTLLEDQQLLGISLF